VSRCRFRPIAWRDLADIIEYIGRDNPQAAARCAAAIQDKCQSLAEMPYLGFRRDFLPENVRIAPVKSYLIYYKILSGGSVEIMRIIHGSRQQESIRLH
jgi:toxin ParE1/3/4